MYKKFDSFDGVCFFNGLIFYAPVALLIRTRAGVSNSTFFMLQALLSLSIFLGEIPAGFVTDKIGYKKSIMISQVVMFFARIMMLLAFLLKSVELFVVEAVLEGVSNCFSSGTNEAYLYTLYGEDTVSMKMAHSGNYGTAGFIVSTISYAFLYKLSGMKGLLLATIATGFVGVIFSIFLKNEKKTNETMKSVSETDYVEKSMDFKMLFQFLSNKKARVYLLMLSTFSLSWILINFFYIEKLGKIGISEEWMSVIILVYSAVQMLGEPALLALKKIPNQLKFVLTGVVAGGTLILFGVFDATFISLLLMCSLPLLLTLPEYLLMEEENKLVDELGMDENRATSLSILNMGVNVIEIVALFASSLFSLESVKWCFVFVGGILIACPLLLFRD